MFFCCPKSFYVLKQFIVTIQLQTARCWASTATVCAKNKTKNIKQTKQNTIPHFQNQKWGGKANLIHVEIVCFILGFTFFHLDKGLWSQNVTQITLFL